MGIIKSKKSWIFFLALFPLAISVIFYALATCPAYFFWHASQLGVYQGRQIGVPDVQVDGRWVELPQWLANTRSLAYPAYELSSARVCGDRAPNLLFLKFREDELDTFLNSNQQRETISLPAGTMTVVWSEDGKLGEIVLLNENSSWVVTASDIHTAREILHWSD